MKRLRTPAGPKERAAASQPGLQVQPRQDTEKRCWITPSMLAVRSRPLPPERSAPPGCSAQHTAGPSDALARGR